MKIYLVSHWTIVQATLDDNYWALVNRRSSHEFSGPSARGPVGLGVFHTAEIVGVAPSAFCKEAWAATLGLLVHKNRDR